MTGLPRTLSTLRGPHDLVPSYTLHPTPYTLTPYTITPYTHTPSTITSTKSVGSGFRGLSRAGS